ncbi:amino acid/amide ABC transporter substrate-binding protein, HAAT family [Paracoccus alcaliphilus]|uniref:Amino acid/amide ABC transporter substrate-binding protein, HAAT family n=1 Tax=Paracoccus alcaliphilus TaxID=34002 RepID=A0A1H8E6K6_9RHOB|nr:ABC transporter substrate-binding protein [Paracoccus alcaliphilus]WCR16755.1 ABC transporter substrate-binding protein [Paracoccus alcaliphilus]SEN15063.1 amino acid/amide ABC transporter substrate-binding protein, HAAT family [Paracoccus alcaliphilus]
MSHFRRIPALLAATTCLAGPVAAQEDDTLTIGLLVTLSGPSAVLGEMARDGFLLAAEEIGEIGGMKTQIIVVDDELKPDVATNKARELVQRNGADIVVGPIFSNIMGAVAKPVTDAGAILISPNAGPSTFAGTECHPNVFATSYQNDQMHEVMGAYAKAQGFDNVFLLAPNYQAGKDALAGFRHSYDGGVAGEIFTQLGQLDYSAELAQIAAMQPDAVFAFMPGGMGVNLVRQYRQAGLETIPFLSAFTVDESTLPAQQDAAIDFLGGSNWAPDLDTPENKAFVEAYEAKFNQVPAVYAMQAYDAAKLIDGAVRQAGGAADRDALLAALKEAPFTSVRGNFSFGPNNFPIQDFYLTKVIQREDGKYATSIVEKIFEDYQDSYVSDCAMN